MTVGMRTGDDGIMISPHPGLRTGVAVVPILTVVVGIVTTTLTVVLTV